MLVDTCILQRLDCTYMYYKYRAFFKDRFINRGFAFFLYLASAQIIQRQQKLNIVHMHCGCNFQFQLLKLQLLLYLCCVLLWSSCATLTTVLSAPS